MGQLATTIEEQIDLLAKRGMILDLSKSKIEEILLDIGYYKLGFYWHYFQKDKFHNFKENTKFSDVLSLYYLDVDLKHILNKAINRIEINFKTKLIYFGSNFYKDDPIWFSDSRKVSDFFVNDFPKIYTPKFVQNNKPLKWHHKKYPLHTYAPAWKTLEFLSLGSVQVLYSCLQDMELKKIISNSFGIKKPKILQNYLKTIVFVRNICAHNDLLYDSNTSFEIETTPMIKFNRNNRHSLDSSIKVILYFLSQISKNRMEEIQMEIGKVFDKYRENPVISKIITERINYIY